MHSRTRISSFLLLSVLILAGCTPQNPAVPPSGARSSSLAAASADVTSQFPYPITQGSERITKKPFGIHITPAMSPVQPEKFSGYHTGTDFETFVSEKDADVHITTICNGTVKFVGWVKGYGGVLIQSCTYQGQPVTVLYGHLRQPSITLTVGHAVTTGDSVAVLGTGESHETDGERKHLHLSVHKGKTVNFRGYVDTEKELGSWIDAYPQ